MLDACKVNCEDDISYEFKRLKQNNKVEVKTYIHLLSYFKRKKIRILRSRRQRSQ